MGMKPLVSPRAEETRQHLISENFYEAFETIRNIEDPNDFDEVYQLVINFSKDILYELLLALFENKILNKKIDKQHLVFFLRSASNLNIKSNKFPVAEKIISIILDTSYLYEKFSQCDLTPIFKNRLIELPFKQKIKHTKLRYDFNNIYQQIYEQTHQLILFHPETVLYSHWLALFKNKVLNKQIRSKHLKFFLKSVSTLNVESKQFPIAEKIISLILDTPHLHKQFNEQDLSALFKNQLIESPLRKKIIETKEASYATVVDFFSTISKVLELFDALSEVAKIKKTQAIQTEAKALDAYEVALQAVRNAENTRVEEIIKTEKANSISENQTTEESMPPSVEATNTSTSLANKVDKSITVALEYIEIGITKAEKSILADQSALLCRSLFFDLCLHLFENKFLCPEVSKPQLEKFFVEFAKLKPNSEIHLVANKSLEIIINTDLSRKFGYANLFTFFNNYPRIIQHLLGFSNLITHIEETRLERLRPKIIKPEVSNETQIKNQSAQLENIVKIESQSAKIESIVKIESNNMQQNIGKIEIKKPIQKKGIENLKEKKDQLVRLMGIQQKRHLAHLAYLAQMKKKEDEPIKQLPELLEKVQIKEKEQTRSPVRSRKPLTFLNDMLTKKPNKPSKNNSDKQPLSGTLTRTTSMLNLADLLKKPKEDPQSEATPPQKKQPKKI